MRACGRELRGFRRPAPRKSPTHSQQQVRAGADHLPWRHKRAARTSSGFLAAFALPVVLFGDLDPRVSSRRRASECPSNHLTCCTDQAFDSYGNKDLYADSWTSIRAVGFALQRAAHSSQRDPSTTQGVGSGKHDGRGVALQVKQSEASQEGAWQPPGERRQQISGWLNAAAERFSCGSQRRGDLVSVPYAATRFRCPPNTSASKSRFTTG